MIVVRLRGGLGNQMFQYAAGRALAHSNQDRLVLDLTLLLDHAPSPGIVPRQYDLDIFPMLRADLTFLSKTATSSFSRRRLYRHASQWVTRLKAAAGLQAQVIESGPRFEPRIVALAGNVYLDGYWQSERYFSGASEMIRNDFLFGSSTDAAIAALAEQIEQANAVCLNVRRADYVDHPLSAKTHGFVGAKYYEDAVARILDSVSQPHFFVFSDDIDWCRANLVLPTPHTFVGHEYKGTKFKDYLRLMSLCRNYIIPNSTFAWWAVWLSKYADKIVVAPQRWFADPALDASDIYLDSWIRL